MEFLFELRLTTFIPSLITTRIFRMLYVMELKRQASRKTKQALIYATKNGITHVDFHPGKERDGVALF